MQDLTATSLLALFETTKEQRVVFAERILESAESGFTDPLQIHLQVRSLQDILDILTVRDEKKNKNADIAKRYNSILFDEAKKHGKTFDYKNATFQEKETGTTYDYSVCNDREYHDLEENYQNAKSALEKRKKYLQSLPEKGQEIVTKEYEVITIYPPTKKSTTSLTVKLK